MSDHDYARRMRKLDRKLVKFDKSERDRLHRLRYPFTRGQSLWDKLPLPAKVIVVVFFTLYFGFGLIVPFY